MYFDHQYLRLMLVTQRTSISTLDYTQFIRKCIKAGVTSVQLREKELENEEFYLFAKQIKCILDDVAIPLLINDRLEVAVSLNVAGVHLGQNDYSPQLARTLLGADKIIGLTVNSLDELITANSLPINYLGVGAIFPTKSKPDVTHIWGLDELKQSTKLAAHPIVAIGGIDQHNIASVLATGVDGVAMISALHDAADPEIIIQNCLAHFQKTS